MSSEIILIGPMAAGKSTQGKLLSEKLGMPRCCVDELRWQYYQEIGYSRETEQEIREKEGLIGVYRYWKPFEAHTVERLLAEHHDCVIDFGAGHSVYEDDALFARVQKVLAPYSNVILLLPSPDPDESVQILYGRMNQSPPHGFDLAAHFVKHHSNHDLAKIVVYTKDKTPEQTRDEILDMLRIG
jgi:adenylate kinase family enzyme